MTKSATQLKHALQRAWLLENLAALLRLLLRMLAISIPLLMLYVWADAVFALPEATRRVWNILLPALVVGTALIGLRPPTPLQDLALRLDKYRRDRRRTISCALDLCDDDSAPRHPGMQETAISEGRTSLKRTSLAALIPFPALAVTGAFALAAGFAAHHLTQTHADVVDIVLARLRDPGADIAPWTRLQFEFLPEDPSVVYGGDIQLGVRIHNGIPEHPVQLRTRIDGVEREAGCFREAEDTFSQRLEQVTQPIEFCFTVGRIRSEWRRVELQVLPRVTGARVHLRPPEYSGFPTREFAFGEQGIEALQGATVTLRVASNRPLAGGELNLHSGADAPPAPIRARIDDDGMAVFRWQLQDDADLSLQLVDLRGNRMDRPLTGRQRVVGDRRPVAVLTEPPRFALATPETRLQVKGHGIDDIGVTRLALIRGMPGFIDRSTVLWEGDPQRRRDFTMELPLDQIGVEPGQTLELFLETRDHRPDAPEIGVSEMVRIQIITTEEYALQLRNREKLDGFRDRFAISSSILQEVGQAYQTLHEVLQGNPSVEEVDAALAEAAAVLERAADVFRALEEDFPIYDLEAAAADSLRNLREHFETQAETLSGMSHRDMDLDLRVQEMAGAFLQHQEDHAPHQEQAENFIKVGELLEQTTRFQQLIQRQEALEREFARYAYSLPPEERDRLRRLERRQRELQEELREWVNTTRDRAEALPNEFESLREQVHEMLENLEKAEADTLMGDAANAAANEANRQAWQRARAALEALRNPPEPDPETGEGGENNFGEMCRGGNPGFGDSPGMANALDQLLNALRNSLGQGQGGSPGGGGGGPGGFSDDGFATRGSSTLDIPVLGPNRMNFDLPRDQRVEGFSLGQGRGGARQATRRTGTATEPGAEALSADEIRIQQTPERYREAVRTFFDLSTE